MKRNQINIALLVGLGVVIVLVIVAIILMAITLGKSSDKSKSVAMFFVIPKELIRERDLVKCDYF